MRNMQTVKHVGSVVQSTAGRDKGALYIVVGKLDYPYVWVADGRKYKADKPKKKNCRHLRRVETHGATEPAGAIRISNERIRSVLTGIGMDLTREVTHV